MQKQARIQIQVPQEVKDMADKAAQYSGISLNQAIKIFISDFSKGEMKVGFTPSHEYTMSDWEEKKLKYALSEAEKQNYASNTKVKDTFEKLTNESNLAELSD